MSKFKVTGTVTFEAVVEAADGHDACTLVGRMAIFDLTRAESPHKGQSEICAESLPEESLPARREAKRDRRAKRRA
jgi:hypothetical protein